jgi:hypothetical protein
VNVFELSELMEWQDFAKGQECSGWCGDFVHVPV